MTRLIAQIHFSIMTRLRYQSWCLQIGLCPSIHIKILPQSKDTLIHRRIGRVLGIQAIQSHKIMDPRRCLIIRSPLPLRNPKTLAYPIQSTAALLLLGMSKKLIFQQQRELLRLVLMMLFAMAMMAYIIVALRVRPQKRLAHLSARG